MSGAHELPAWTFADVWLLTAIAQFGKRGCSLSELIGAADGLNHDIPTAAQAAIVLGRLKASGLVETHCARYCVTSAGHSVYQRRHGGMFDLSGSVLAELGSVPRLDGRVGFGPGEFQAAYDEYARR